MEKRKCKNTDLELSVLGTGCWSFGGGTYWGQQDQKDVNQVVHASVDLGINYFDTAEAYNDGRSESSLGEAIREIQRDKALIGSKVSPSNCYKETLIRHCEDSLKRLQTDYIDIYMLHWPFHPHAIRHFTNRINIIENPPKIEEALEALRILKKQGKIRYFGVSNFSSNRLKNLPQEEIIVNQLPYNLLCRAIEYDTLPHCREKEMGVISYMALLQGILSGKYASIEEIPLMQRRTRHFDSAKNSECRHGEAGAEQEFLHALEEIRAICKSSGLSMAEVAIQWIVQNPAITCTLAGARNITQLGANVKAVDVKLSQDILDELDIVTQRLMNKLGNHFDYYESAENDRTI
jgi:aryl-alcohol dehydrogenase-like predicted oxidoreductase